MKRFLIIVVSALAIVSCSVKRAVGVDSASEVLVAPNDSLQAIVYYAEGVKNRITGKSLEQSDVWFNKALELDSLHAPSWYEKAWLYMEGNPDTALLFCRKATAIDTLNLEAQGLLARLLIVTSNYPEARRIYERLVVDDPLNALNYRMLAALYEYDHRPFTAIGLLDSAEYKLGRIAELSDYKRQLLVGVKLFDKAIGETKALIDEAPYLSQNYRYLAELYAQTNKDSLAQATYRQALRLDSTNVDTQYSMAEYYRRRNIVPQYFSMVERIMSNPSVTKQAKIKLFGELTMNQDFYRDNYFAINSLAVILVSKYPTDFEIVQLFATHLIRSGELEQALQLYKNYTQSSEQNIEAYYSILDIESYLKHSDSVALYSQRALELYPHNVDLYLRKGYSLQTLGRNKEALSTYRQALKYAQSDSVKSSVSGTVGDLYFAWNKPLKCFDTYRKALKYDPDNAVVLNNFAYYLSEMPNTLGRGRMEEALQMSTRSIELTPGNATYLDTKAWILYRLGRYEEAKQLLMQAIAFDSTQSDTLLLHYGDILHALGDDFMAGEYWRRALEMGGDAKQIEERLKSLKQ